VAETRIRVTNFERFSIFGKKIVHSHFLHFAWPASLIGARRNSHVVDRERLTETEARRVLRGARRLLWFRRPRLEFGGVATFKSGWYVADKFQLLQLP